MPKFHRTEILKIASQPIYSQINAASASVWNECLALMDFYQYQRGYRHAHNHFYFGSDCEGWMDKKLSKKQPLHSQSIQADFSRAISQCKHHSKRWWKLTRRKWKRIRKIDNQIKDALHQHTTKFLKYCQAKGVGTIVLGDLTGIRKNIDYGKRTNQRLHQWAFGKITDLITYKAKAVGIKVEIINEAYTSQTCPKCGNRKKPNNRNYTCACGFQYHRDGVGAINIRRKYLGHFGVPVVADMGTLPMKMTPPLGFRLKVPVALA